MAIIDYNLALCKYNELIDYAVTNSDTFYLITKLKKPYSKRPPDCIHDQLLSPLSPFLIEQKVWVREWAGTKNRDMHAVMNVYKSTAGAKVALRTLPNLLKFDLNQPQDLSFLRDGKYWLISCTHEKFIHVYSMTQKDQNFLKQLGDGSKPLKK